MKNLLPCKVLRIPTDKPTNLYTRSNDELFNTIGISGFLPPQSTKDDVKGLHLAIVSKRAIKKGNWITDGVKIYQAPDTDIDAFIGLYKIEATNYTAIQSAHLGHLLGQKENGCGTIPDSFVEAFCKAKGDIKEVNLEITPNSKGDIADGGKDYFIKTRSDNTVIIHRTKMYSRSEVEDLIYTAMKSVGYTSVDTFNKFIDKHL